MEQTIIYDENNNRLFYLIWRNVYLRKKILTDCLFFRNNRKTKFIQIGKINLQRKFYDYFTDIKINKIDDTIVYPMFLEKITFGEDIKYISNEILIKLLTENRYLKNIVTSYYFNQCIFTIMASISTTSISSITFNDTFNRPLPISLSCNKNLKKLEFGSKFNQEIDNLPVGLNHLTLNQSQQGKYATPYKYCIPSLDLSFLKSLTSLEFGNGFNNPIPVGSLSNGGVLKSIKFGTSFNYPLSNGIIPDGVESIHITNKNYPTVYQESIQLPNSLKYLKVAFYSNELLSDIPNTLHTLVFSQLVNDDEFHLKKLPQNIIRLEFDEDFKSKLPELPSSLTQLVLSKKHTNSDYYQSLKIIRPKPQTTNTQ